MLPTTLQDVKHDYFILPQAIVDNDDPVGAQGDAAPKSVDTLGFDFLHVMVRLGATDIALTELALYFSDTDSAGAATIDADLTFSGSTGTSRLPQATDDNELFVLRVDLRDKSRYVFLGCTVGDGTSGGFVVAEAILFGGGESLKTVTERGAVAELVG